MIFWMLWILGFGGGHQPTSESGRNNVLPATSLHKILSKNIKRKSFPQQNEAERRTTFNIATVGRYARSFETGPGQPTRPPPVLDWTGLILFQILQVMDTVVPQIRKGGVDTVFVMACRPPNMSVCYQLTWLIAKLTAAYHKCGSSSRIPVSPAVYRTQSPLSYVSLRGSPRRYYCK